MIETLEEIDEFDDELNPYGPRGGGVSGVVRRVRRILDVSQRDLAALLGISQSQVARWETGRTSPRAEMLVRLVRMARLELTLRDSDGDLERPMRDDGARDRAGRRYPAHVDLAARRWWSPRGSESSIGHRLWVRRSRAVREPAVSYHVKRWRRQALRQAFGTPVDHPSLIQLAAEVEWCDERREDRRVARGGRADPPDLRRTA